MQLFSSWTGADFLAFYSVMLGFAGMAAIWIPANLRPSGRGAPPDDPEEIAFLTGGADRLSQTVLTDLYTRGAIGSALDSRLEVERSFVPAGRAGAAVLAIPGKFTLSEAALTLAAEAERIEARLVRRGLLIAQGERWKLRLLASSPFLALLALAEYRRAAGAALGEPTGFLVLLMALTGVLAVVRFLKGNSRTEAGQAAVRKLESGASRLRRAPRPEEAALAVALFGTGVLVGTPWEPVHALRQNSGDGGGSNSGGDGDGGSGCGGGCGGCGG